MAITLHVRLSNGTKFPVTLNDDCTLTETTILAVKEKISEVQDDCPANLQRLIYKGRILEDDRTLSDYAIVNESTLHLVKSRRPVESRPSPSTTVPSTPPVGSQPSNPQQQNQQPPNPFMGMPPMQDFSQVQQQMTPERMSQMMNSPLMQGLLDNPETMRAMMEMNPQMRQLMDSNPQLREVFNNPQLLRQSMEMMRNPQAMQHMMRSQDLAMSQLENMPGGFAALSNMYRDVQEPMMEAMQSQNNSTGGGSESRSNEHAGSGASGTAMPNPWGSSSPNRGSGATAPTTSTPNPTGIPPLGNPWGGMGASGATASNPWSAQPSPQQLEQTLQMLENPMMSQMMDQFLSNPQMMEQLLSANPMMQQLRQTNPQAAAMMSNPEMMRAMMRPDNLRAMMQLQNSMQQLQQQGFPMMGMMPPPNMQGGGTAGSGSAGDNNLDFTGLLNQMQATSLGGTNPQPRQEQHPADRFRVQLQSLRDMGFDDELASLRALQANGGNLNRAVDMLLMGTVPEHVPGVPSSAAPSDTTTQTASSSNNDSETSQSQAEEESAPPKGNIEKKND